MQVELFKSEDVKFSIFKPPAFRKYFAFYGLIRTDTAMLLIDLLILSMRCTHSDIQTAILGHVLFWYQTVQPYSVGRKKPTSHHGCVRADSGVFIANPEGK